MGPAPGVLALLCAASVSSPALSLSTPAVPSPKELWVGLSDSEVLAGAGRSVAGRLQGEPWWGANPHEIFSAPSRVGSALLFGVAHHL